MKLKAAILDAMATDQLRQCAKDFEVEVDDRRKRDVLIAALRRKRSISKSDLLEYLSEVEVKEVCEALEVPVKGRRGALIERLLAESRSASEGASAPSEQPSPSQAEDDLPADGGGDSSNPGFKSYTIRLTPDPNVREMTEVMRADAARAVVSRKPTESNTSISNKSGPMKNITADSAEAQSADIVTNNIEQLKELFPEAFTEGRIDFEVLKQLLGGSVDEREEKYGLNWHGKRRARQLALTPSTGTLRPCPEDSVDWDTTQNLMIEGDNLEVLKLLQKSYAGKVKLIYIDPPYNTGKDFVYPDNFQDNIKNYLELTGQVEGGRKISSNTEASGRFHTDWLNMMYPRLKLAKNLLESQGVILISIGDGEVGNLRAICDEVFGEECLICQFTWVKKRKGSHLSDTHRSMTEYVLAYSRDKTGLSLFGESAYSDKLQPLAKKTNAIKELRFPASMVKTTLEDGLYKTGERGEGDSSLLFKQDFRVVGGAVTDEIVVSGPFVWTQSKLSEEIDLGTTIHLSSKFGFNVGRHDQSEKFKAPSTLISGVGTNEDAFEELTDIFGAERVFDFTKPTSLIQYLINAVTFSSKTGVILDFFAGSGTTGQAVMGLNALDAGSRRFIVVQLPEPLDPEDGDQATAAAYCKKLKKPLNIAELTKERLRRAGKKIKPQAKVATVDAGFRVLKLDKSNIRAWQPGANLERDLVDSIEHIVRGRSEQDVLTELLLKLGLDLCVPIETRQIASKSVHAIGGGVVLTCLDTRITAADAEPLALGIADWHRQLAPAGDSTCVFRDSAFADDVAKTNLAAILQQHGIANVRSL